MSNSQAGRGAPNLGGPSIASLSTHQAQKMAPTSFDASAYNCDIFDPLLIRFLRRLQAKPIEGTQDRFELQPGAYSACVDSIKQDDQEVWAYVQDKLRHELISDKLLVIMMASSFHEFVHLRVHRSIIFQLGSLEQSSTIGTKQLVHDICELGSAKIEFKDDFRCPDQQYMVKGCDFSGVVVEMAVTQMLEDLSSKAEYLLAASKGGIQVIIGLKAGCKSGEEASFHVWRTDVTGEGDNICYGSKKVVEEGLISKNAIPSGLFAHKLEDFAPSQYLALHYPNANLQEEIVLQYKDLAELIEEGRALQTKRISNENADRSSGSNGQIAR